MILKFYNAASEIWVSSPPTAQKTYSATIAMYRTSTSEENRCLLVSDLDSFYVVNLSIT